ncbi:hypothetical protein HY090_01595 [Candidatus Kaiserbacteria bacterium]|nr:hypothetical protein [Candidatus Kaiserbacteria bacterium]
MKKIQSPNQNASHKRLRKLFDEVERVLDEKNFSEKDKIEIKKNLEGVVSVEIMRRVSGDLSEVEKKQFVEALQDLDKNGNADKVHTVAGDLFKSRINETNEDRIYTEATDNVLKEFLEKMPV